MSTNGNSINQDLDGRLFLVCKHLFRESMPRLVDPFNVNIENDPGKETRISIQGCIAQIQSPAERTLPV